VLLQVQYSSTYLLTTCQPQCGPASASWLASCYARQIYLVWATLKIIHIYTFGMWSICMPMANMTVIRMWLSVSLSGHRTQNIHIFITQELSV